MIDFYIKFLRSGRSRTLTREKQLVTQLVVWLQKNHDVDTQIQEFLQAILPHINLRDFTQIIDLIMGMNTHDASKLMLLEKIARNSHFTDFNRILDFLPTVSGTASDLQVLTILKVKVLGTLGGIQILQILLTLLN